MATGVGGTNYSWRALEPYPIESELAKTAMGSPQGAVSAVSAGAMLQGYQADRQLAQAGYAQDVQQQQQFQRDQLAAQMADNNAKAVIEAGKAGMLPMFHAMYSGGVPGADDNAFNYTAGQLDAAQRAKTLQESGTAFNQFAQGGFQSPDIPGSVGISGTMTDPALVRAAQIRASAQLAGDRLKAGSSGGMRYSTGDPALGVNLSGKIPPDIAADPVKREAWLRSQGIGAPPQAPSPYSSGAASTSPPPSSGTPQPGSTNLPYAKTEGGPGTQPPASGGGGGGGGGGVDKATAAVRATVEANKTKMSPQVYGDLSGATVQRGSDGKGHVIGKSGKDYGPLGG